MMKILTEEGYQKLVDELEERRSTIRHEIAAAIKEAKEQGDLSENAEYSEAKHRQNENESRVLELEAIIKAATVVERTAQSQTVEIGSKVSIKCKGKDMSFEIVGSNEVDPAAGKISSESPIGKALMGKAKGDMADIDVPAGKMKCEVVSIA
jgi:transcription elongation factor GreA